MLPISSCNCVMTLLSFSIYKLPSLYPSRSRKLGLMTASFPYSLVSGLITPPWKVNVFGTCDSDSDSDTDTDSRFVGIGCPAQLWTRNNIAISKPPLSERVLQMNMKKNRNGIILTTIQNPLAIVDQPSSVPRGIRSPMAQRFWMIDDITKPT